MGTAASAKNKIRSTKKAKLTAKFGVNGKYILRLYITGTTPQSQRALANIKRICEEFLAGRYELQVIDIYQKPALAKDEQIIAAPTLVKLLPHPLRRLIGDLSNDERVLFGLDLRHIIKEKRSKAVEVRDGH